MYFGNNKHSDTSSHPYQTSRETKIAGSNQRERLFIPQDPEFSDGTFKENSLGNTDPLEDSWMERKKNELKHTLT